MTAPCKKFWRRLADTFQQFIAGFIKQHGFGRPLDARRCWCTVSWVVSGNITDSWSKKKRKSWNLKLWNLKWRRKMRRKMKQKPVLCAFEGLDWMGETKMAGVWSCWCILEPQWPHRCTKQRSVMDMREPEGRGESPPVWAVGGNSKWVWAHRVKQAQCWYNIVLVRRIAHRPCYLLPLLLLLYYSINSTVVLLLLCCCCSTESTTSSYRT